jgi:hypothetical protein
MSTLRVGTFQNTAGTQSTSAENLINGCAKAWVNFNGSGTVAIRQSFNVSSITDNGTGDYTINFTNALADANFVLAGAANSVSWYGGLHWQGTVPTTTSVRVATTNDSFGGSLMDPSYASLAVFR